MLRKKLTRFDYVVDLDMDRKLKKIESPHPVVRLKSKMQFESFPFTLFKFFFSETSGILDYKYLLH